MNRNTFGHQPEWEQQHNTRLKRCVFCTESIFSTPPHSVTQLSPLTNGGPVGGSCTATVCETFRCFSLFVPRRYLVTQAHRFRAQTQGRRHGGILQIRSFPRPLSFVSDVASTMIRKQQQQHTEKPAVFIVCCRKCHVRRPGSRFWHAQICVLRSCASSSHLKFSKSRPLGYNTSVRLESQFDVILGSPVAECLALRLSVRPPVWWNQSKPTAFYSLTKNKNQFRSRQF